MSSVPFDPRQEGLVRELSALTSGLAEFREALHPINDERLRTVFRDVLDGAERIVAAHARRPGTSIADDIANLRSLFVRHDIPREDPDLGKVPSLAALRSARGSILADFDSVLTAAQSLGKVPNNPEVKLPTGAELERVGREGQLAALEQRLLKVENDLQTKIAPESRLDEGHSPQQIGLVNFYVNAMKIELILARLETKARDLIDLASLTRAVEAIGELTTDFISTVQGLRDKVTESLKNAALAIRPTVRRVAVGLRTMVSWVRRSARRIAGRVHFVEARLVAESQLVAESLSVPPPVIGQPLLTEGEQRRFQIGDTVRFRADSRLRLSFDIATEEVGTVVGVEPHPPQTGPSYRVQVQFPRVLVPFAFSFEYELVKPAPERMIQVGIWLKRARTDPKERDPRYQEELRQFSQSLRTVGTVVAQRGVAFDSVNVRGYPFGEFVVSLTDAIGPTLGDILASWLQHRSGRSIRIKVGEFEAEARKKEDVHTLVQAARIFQETRSSRPITGGRLARFTLGEVWRSRQGRRAVIIATEDDDHRGKLHFEDSGDEEWQNWAGLTAHGQWQVETSPRPLRSADELKEMILQRIRKHPVCPQRMSVDIERTVGSDWKAISIPPPDQHIAYADCSNYIAYIANVIGFLYGLSEE
jgi:hypothetical protein